MDVFIDKNPIKLIRDDLKSKQINKIFQEEVIDSLQVTKQQTTIEKEN